MNLRYWLPFPTWVWLIVISLNLVWSCNPRSASAAPMFSECGMDSHCINGQYCNYPTKSCVNCTDCSKFKLLPGISDCARGKVECGQCQQGFTLDDGSGHCFAIPRMDSKPRTNSGAEQPSNGDGGPGGISLALIVVAATCVPILVFCLAFAGIVYYKKFRRPQPPPGTELALIPSHSNGSGETGVRNKVTHTELGGVPEEYYPPPPYNLFGFPLLPLPLLQATSTCLPEPERAILLSAVPDGPSDLGNFPSQQIYYLQAEGDAVVPTEQANLIDSIAPNQNSMLADEEVSATMVDLSELIFNNSSPEIEGEHEPEIPNQQQERDHNELPEQQPTPARMEIPLRTSTPIVDMVEEEQNMDNSHGNGNEIFPPMERSFNFVNPPNSSIVLTPRPGPSRNDSGHWSPLQPPPEEFLLEVHVSAILRVVNHPNGANDNDQPQIQLAGMPMPGGVLENAFLDEGFGFADFDDDFDMEGNHGNRDVPVVPELELEDSYLEDVEGTEFFVVDENH